MIQHMLYTKNDIERTVRVMKKRFIFLIPILLLIIACGIFVGLDRRSTQTTATIVPLPSNYNQLETVYSPAQVLFNLSDKAKLAASTDYIFVGYLDKIVGTSYRDIREIGGKQTGTPYTHFLITDLFNIKGRLQTDKSLPVEMFGGVDINETCVLLTESKSIPEEGHYYIFMVSVSEQDELYLDAQCDLGREINQEEISAYFDAWNSQMHDTPDESASPEIQAINEYVIAFENRDLDYEKKERFHSSYEMD